MRKVSARWVPRELSEEHQKTRMATSLEILQRYENDGEAFLERIVTGDESWVHYWTPETKSQSMVWKTADEAAPRKFKAVPSAGKVMVTAFWDQKGVLLMDYLPQSMVVTANTYFDMYFGEAPAGHQTEEAWLVIERCASFARQCPPSHGKSHSHPAQADEMGSSTAFFILSRLSAIRLCPFPGVENASRRKTLRER